MLDSGQTLGGWKGIESHRTERSDPRTAIKCSKTGFKSPVWTYRHSEAIPLRMDSGSHTRWSHTWFPASFDNTLQVRAPSDEEKRNDTPKKMDGRIWVEGIKKGNATYQSIGQRICSSLTYQTIWPKAFYIGRFVYWCIWPNAAGLMLKCRFGRSRPDARLAPKPTKSPFSEGCLKSRLVAESFPRSAAKKSRISLKSVSPLNVWLSNWPRHSFLQRWPALELYKRTQNSRTRVERDQLLCRIDTLIHTLIINHCGHTRLIKAMDGVQDLIDWIARVQDAPEVALPEHIQIAETICARDAVWVPL
jgi:hypothetical protein